MTKTFIAKRVVSTVVGIGTTKIIHSIISSTTDPKSATDQVAIMASSYVLAAMVVEKTRAFTDAKIDKAIAQWKQLSETLKEI